MYVIKYKLHKNLRIVCTSVVNTTFHKLTLPTYRKLTLSPHSTSNSSTTPTFPTVDPRIFGGQDQVLFRDSLKR